MFRRWARQWAWSSTTVKSKPLHIVNSVACIAGQTVGLILANLVKPALFRATISTDEDKIYPVLHKHNKLLSASFAPYFLTTSISSYRLSSSFAVFWVIQRTGKFERKFQQRPEVSRSITNRFCKNITTEGVVGVRKLESTAVYLLDVSPLLLSYNQQ